MAKHISEDEGFSLKYYVSIRNATFSVNLLRNSSPSSEINKPLLSLMSTVTPDELINL